MPHGFGPGLRSQVEAKRKIVWSPAAALAHDENLLNDVHKDGRVAVPNTGKKFLLREIGALCVICRLNETIGDGEGTFPVT